LHLYNAADGAMVPVADAGAGPALWDVADASVFAVCPSVGTAGGPLCAYKYEAASLRGPRTTTLSGQPPPSGYRAPLALCDGVLTFQSAGGALDRVVLASHTWLQAGAGPEAGPETAARHGVCARILCMSAR
jgi:hypothetical protein